MPVIRRMKRYKLFFDLVFAGMHHPYVILNMICFDLLIAVLTADSSLCAGISVLYHLPTKDWIPAILTHETCILTEFVMVFLLIGKGVIKQSVGTLF